MEIRGDVKTETTGFIGLVFFYFHSSPHLQICGADNNNVVLLCLFPVAIRFFGIELRGKNHVPRNHGDLTARNLTRDACVIVKHSTTEPPTGGY